jgi:ketosteroid isomerase-like protein
MAERDAEIEQALRRSHDAFNDNDFEAATALAHPEVEMVRSWEQTPLKGPDALQAWLKPDAFQEQRMKLLEVTVCGDKALVFQNMRAKGAESGIPIDVDSWAVWTFDEDGLVTRVEFFLHHEKDKARAAAGLGA